MQSQSQSRSRPETPDEAAVSRKVAPASSPVPPGSDPEAANSRKSTEDYPHNDVPSASSPVAPGNDADERQSHIAAEAYRIAEERGFPPNSEVDHWYEAQRRLGYAGLDLAASSNGSSSERM